MLSHREPWPPSHTCSPFLLIIFRTSFHKKFQVSDLVGSWMKEPALVSTCPPWPNWGRLKFTQMKHLPSDCFLTACLTQAQEADESEDRIIRNQICTNEVAYSRFKKATQGPFSGYCIISRKALLQTVPNDTAGLRRTTWNWIKHQCWANKVDRAF